MIVRCLCGVCRSCAAYRDASRPFPAAPLPTVTRYAEMGLAEFGVEHCAARDEVATARPPTTTHARASSARPSTRSAMTTTTTLIESRTNRLGIEVRHEKHGLGEHLRAYRNGELVAEQRVIRYRSGRLVDLNIDFVDATLLTPTREERDELGRALREGLRVLRDGRGLCEVA